jgi:hypothetical protein
MEDYCFYAETIQTGIVKKTMSSVRNLISQFVIVINEEGLHMNACNKGKTILFTATLKAEKFEKFVYKKPLQFGLSAEIFGTIIKDMHTTDILRFYVIDNDYNFRIQIANEHHGTTVNIAIAMLNIFEIVDCQIENEESLYKVQIPGALFYQSCKVFVKFSSTLTLKGTPSAFHLILQTEGIQRNDTFDDTKALIVAPSDKEISITYSSSTLNSISKFYIHSKGVSFLLDPEFIAVSYDIGILGHCRFILVV